MTFLNRLVPLFLFLALPVWAQIAHHPLWVYDQASGTSHHIDDIERVHGGEFFSSGPKGYSPQQIHRAYGFDQFYTGTFKLSGHRERIAIVSAFHYPTAAHDLKKFISTFNLREMYGLPGKAPCTAAAGPHPCFQLVFARGVQPPVDPGWALESALDIQWAHAIAQGADIILVEASSNNLGDLFQAVDVAVNMNPSVVSMSWGATEFPTQSIFEPIFNRPTISFVAGSGDTGNVTSYPATSPNVIGVGGTKLRLDKHGNRLSPESAWIAGGGGLSQFFALPTFQANHPIPNIGGKRGSPDVAYNADPKTGVSVYTSTPVLGSVGWIVAGGTSAGGPQWAGLLAMANQLRLNNLTTTNLTNRPEYKAARGPLYKANYNDIKTGSNGACGPVCTAGPGYDFTTGLGTPKAENLVWFLGLDVRE